MSFEALLPEENTPELVAMPPLTIEISPTMFGPNSRGQFGNLVCRKIEANQGTMGTAYGSFYVPAKVMGLINYAENLGEAGSGSVDGIGHDLSRSSNIYSGSELQPSSLLCQIAIRF